MRILHHWKAARWELWFNQWSFTSTNFF